MHRKALRNIIFFILVFAFFAYKEYAAPYWRYHIETLITKNKPPYTAELANGLALEIYSDARPHVGKIAGIQKGLILKQYGKDLVGEGYGLGLPLVVANGVSWLASEAKIGKFEHGDTTVLSKLYVLDTQEHDVQFPRRRYIKTRPVGTIRIDYLIYQNTIEVNADLKGLVDADFEYVYFMNEQSGKDFRYGLNPLGQKIDLIQWQAPIPMAMLGIHAPRLGITFWVRDNMETLKYLGRETLARWHWYGHESTNWAGCELRLDNKKPTFQYFIKLDNKTAD
ncbi:MAG: hypothetical protein H6696_10875 [Deferribacteres bacterium]|nr:hypothetical protein [candidate division KSB1 bacterium]MCB9502434.1 hypothetical protein [Deferribacteres bacterium]